MFDVSARSELRGRPLFLRGGSISVSLSVSHTVASFSVSLSISRAVLLLFVAFTFDFEFIFALIAFVCVGLRCPGARGRTLISRSLSVSLSLITLSPSKESFSLSASIADTEDEVVVRERCVGIEDRLLLFALESSCTGIILVDWDVTVEESERDRESSESVVTPRPLPRTAGCVRAVCGVGVGSAAVCVVLDGCCERV